MKYRGIIEVTAVAEADSEEEAQQKMAAQLIKELKNKLENFICWPIDETVIKGGRKPMPVDKSQIVK